MCAWCMYGRVGHVTEDQYIESFLILHHYLASRDLSQLVRLTQQAHWAAEPPPGYYCEVLYYLKQTITWTRVLKLKGKCQKWLSTLSQLGEDLQNLPSRANSLLHRPWFQLMWVMGGRQSPDYFSGWHGEDTSKGGRGTLNRCETKAPRRFEVCSRSQSWWAAMLRF